MFDIKLSRQQLDIAKNLTNVDMEGAWADLTKYVESGGARQQGKHEQMQKYVEELAKMRRPMATSS